MAPFDGEHYKTSEKMANLVMEYAAQFIARDYLEAYEKAGNDDSGEFVPTEFDDKIYKKISKQVKRSNKSGLRAFRMVACIAVAAISALCIGFTALVLSNEVLRQSVIEMFGIF